MATRTSILRRIQATPIASSIDQVTPLTYAGVFLITLANLMFENLLNRIFSVTMFYNLAFMIVSIALFGMSVGAIIVFVGDKIFKLENVKNHLTISSLLFAVTIVISFFIHTQVMIDFSHSNITGSLALNFIIFSIPFIFGGITVSLALTRIPGQVSKLYAADLIGAALGCVLFVVTLNYFSGPTSVVVIAVLAAVGALLFALDAKQRHLQIITLLSGLLLVVLAVVQVALAGSDSAPLRIKWIKGQIERPLLYEKWNSYSRVRVWESENTENKPFGWGLSTSQISPDVQIPRQISLDIDAAAATVLTEYHGDLSPLAYLKTDVTNMVHYIRPDSNVLIIGTGGGRDVLSSLVFGQPSITGVEINEDILDILNNRFGDFTGHLDQLPGVKFEQDEARSYIARSKEQFDIIQLSLIDTWAATSAGAYVFTESSLYTTDTWKIFMDHLTPSGVITYSRWYFPDMPGEMYRLTTLASASLMEYGIENPRDHIIVIRYMPNVKGMQSPDGIGTLLVSKTPFSQKDLETLRNVSKEMHFEIVLSSQDSLDPNFTRLTTREGFQSFIGGFPLDISPPTDDRPFFFHYIRLEDLLKNNLSVLNQGAMSFNMIAVLSLGILLVTVILLTFLCIIIPLLLTHRRINSRGAIPYLFYFAGIGIGFMLVEISQMQRLTIFLGHPTYSMATALFALLLSSGLGSYLTRNVDVEDLKKMGMARLALLLGVLVLFGLITPVFIRIFTSSENVVRILVSVTLLSPLGLFMGMAFPLGMKAASKGAQNITPWLWGINGATSVFASVIAIVIALSFSISTSYWTGFASYALAFLSFGWITRKL